MDEQERQMLKAAVQSQLDQAQMSVRQFVRNNSLHEIVNLLSRYADASNCKDDAAALDGILASYGLMQAILDVVDDDEQAAQRQGGGGDERLH